MGASPRGAPVKAFGVPGTVARSRFFGKSAPPVRWPGAGRLVTGSLEAF